MKIIGHVKIIERLRKEIGDKSFSQAYIFSGPEGVGKYFLAEEFARGIIRGKDFSVLSPQEREEAEFDLLRLSPEKEEKNRVIREKEITLDQIKARQKELATFPYSGKAKVLIVNDSDRMNRKAQNAMLKTIEEPNSTAVIILIASRLENILPTVKSRCRIIGFNLVSEKDLEKYLTDQGLAPDPEAVNFSMGRPGAMLEMVADREKIDWYRNSRKKLSVVLLGGLGEKIKIAEELSKNIPEALKHIHFWLWNFQRAGSVQEILRSEKLAEAADKLKNTNANARLLLENIFLNL